MKLPAVCIRYMASTIHVLLTDKWLATKHKFL